MKVKVSTLGILDMLKLKNTAKTRRRVIQHAPNSKIGAKDRINELAQYYHPSEQHLLINKIIEEMPGVRTFWLTPDPAKGTMRLAPFRAGSCITVTTSINGSIASRVYSLCSSPKDPYYVITVKEKADGFLSPYLLSQAKVGDEITASEPYGEMTYSSLRDAEHVVAVAGGTGITPFRSMARAIHEGTEDFSLTILYIAKTRKELLYRAEFDELAKSDPKFRIVYVLSREDVEGYEHGHITAEMLQKYMGESQCSFFVAGPGGMCDSVAKEITYLGVLPKFIRVEHTAALAEGMQAKTFVLTVIHEGRKWTLPMESSETVLTALERSGFSAKHKCRVGHCGYCRSRLLSGTYHATRYERLRLADAQFGYFHPCCSYPTSDLTIEVY